MYHTNIYALTNLLSSHKVFVDTCSLMHSEANVFFARLIPELERRNVKIHIPLSVTAEIIKNEQRDRSEQCRASAHAAYKIVNSLTEKELVNMIANSSDKTFADHVIGVFLESERMDRNLLLITQDRGLAKKAVMCNIDHAVRGKEIKVMKINANGGIDNWDVDRLLEEIQNDIWKARMLSKKPSQIEFNPHSYEKQHSTPRTISHNRQQNCYSRPRVATAVPKKPVTSKSKSNEICIDCGAPFTVTVDEARSLMQKGYNFPKRCPSCRNARKIRSNANGFEKLSYR